MMAWLATAGAAAASGVLVALLFLLIIYKFIPRGEKGLGEYYFQLALQGHRRSGWVMVMESSSRVVWYVLAVALLALPSWAVGMAMELAPFDWRLWLARAAEYVQGCATLLLSLMITTVVVFASLKKSYYAVFDISDVARKYKLFGRVLFCLMAHAACFLTLGIAKAFPFSAGWSAAASIFVMLLTLWVMADALLVLTHSFRIIFSVNRCEFKLLEGLFTHARENDFSLAGKKCGDPAVARSMSQYLIARLTRAGRAFTRGLGRGPEIAQVEFFDVAQAPLQKGIARVPRYAWSMLTMSFPFALLFLGLLMNESFFIPLLPAVRSAVLLGSCLATALASGLMLRLCEPLRQMCRIGAYGSWAYRFVDSLGQAVCYASENAPLALRTKDAAWLRSLMSLLALFRILLLSGTWRIMLEDLEGELLQIPAGERGMDGLGIPHLPYYLCCCLAYERLAMAEGRQVLDRLKALPFDWSRPAFRSFARAVLIDLTRDYALAGRMDDNVQQALMRPLELPGACLPE